MKEASNFDVTRAHNPFAPIDFNEVMRALSDNYGEAMRADDIKYWVFWQRGILHAKNRHLVPNQCALETFLDIDVRSGKALRLLIDNECKYFAIRKSTE